MNRTAAVVIAIAAAVLVAALAGCDLGDLVRVDTPRGVQTSEALPPDLSLNDARHEFENWLAAVRNDAARWRADIERSDALADLIRQATLQGLDDVGPSLAGVPVLGPAVPLLTALAAWFAPRPGEKKKRELAVAETRELAKTEQKAAENAAWDEAVRQTRDLLLARTGE